MQARSAEAANCPLAMLCMQVASDVRIANLTCSGRLEVLYKSASAPQGTWVPVCASGFGRLEASVACAQLGCRNSGSVVRAVPTRDRVWPDGVKCQGSERNLRSQCSLLKGLGVNCTKFVVIKCG